MRKRRAAFSPLPAADTGKQSARRAGCMRGGRYIMTWCRVRTVRRNSTARAAACQRRAHLLPPRWRVLAGYAPAPHKKPPAVCRERRAEYNMNTNKSGGLFLRRGGFFLFTLTLCRFLSLIWRVWIYSIRRGRACLPLFHFFRLYPKIRRFKR